MEKSIADLASIPQSMQQQNEPIKSALEENTAMIRDISLWKPQVDADVGSLRKQMGMISEKVGTLVEFCEALQPALKVFKRTSTEMTPPAVASGLSPFLNSAQGPNGHRLHDTHRSDGFGVVTTLTPRPVTGVQHFSISGSPINTAPHQLEPVLPTSVYPAHLTASLPNLSFPQFDGHHPKVWKTKCESYFEVFAISVELWVKIASQFCGHSCLLASICRSCYTTHSLV